MRLLTCLPGTRSRCKVCLLALAVSLVSCGGGSSSDTAVDSAPSSPTTPSTPETPSTPVPTSPTPVSEDVLDSSAAAARFLTQATFGPTLDDIEGLVGGSVSEWVLAQFDQPPSYFIDYLEDFEQSELIAIDWLRSFSNTFAFWHHSINAQDQLRQRVAFALSEILVVSSYTDDFFQDEPIPIASYQDILIDHAFGNYLDMLKEVTYSPTMGRYLTYMGNQKADPESGRVPDENYAREILQLFSTGLLALNMDGSVQTDSSGAQIELYSNEDITGLAKVFTGLDIDWQRAQGFDNYGEAFAIPMVMYEEWHSAQEKSFLGLTIAANTEGEESIDLALEHIFSQSSVAPFIARQLIQRLVTSHPEPDYIERVAMAFENGQFTMPNGDLVGEARKGDMQATIAAILLDPDARHDVMDADLDLALYGKVREPVLRFSAWARAFELQSVSPELMPSLWFTSDADSLNQHPYRSNSVFNFYRPGYVAPGTETGALGLTMPELQVVNASSVPGYINFITGFTMAWVQVDGEAWAREFAKEGIDVDLSAADDSFLPIYDREVALAEDAHLLIDHLDILLLSGNLSDNTRAEVIAAIELVPLSNTGADYDGAELRVQLAIIMLMTSADFLVQR